MLFQSDIKKYFTNRAHRRKRIYDRLGNYKTYIKNPKELLWKYKATHRANYFISKPEILALQQKVQDLFYGQTYAKYTDFKRYFIINLRRIYRLGLHKSSPVRILDIGSGAGFFCWLCKQYGHDVHALDIPGVAIFDYLIPAFNIPRTYCYIQPSISIPKMDQSFHLIVAFAICFHELEGNHRWNRNNWLYFLNDIKKNFAHSGTKMHLFFNDHPHGDFEQVKSYVTSSNYTIKVGHKTLEINF